jgi:hypothetical protein
MFLSASAVHYDSDGGITRDGRAEVIAEIW